MRANAIYVICVASFGAYGGVAARIRRPDVKLKGSNTTEALSRAKEAIQRSADERSVSVLVVTESDHQRFLDEAAQCTQTPECCLCNGELAHSAPNVLAEVATAIKESRGIVVEARKDSGMAAFAFCENDGDVAEIKYLCQRPVNCNHASAKSGQLAFVMTLVEAADRLDSKRATLEVAAKGDEINSPAEELYRKFCFGVTQRHPFYGTSMQNEDLMATVNFMPDLLERKRSCPDSTAPQMQSDTHNSNTGEHSQAYSEQIHGPTLRMWSAHPIISSGNVVGDEDDDYWGSYGIDS